MLNKWLFTRMDNSALIVFRIIFGLLIAIEAFGAILTGWVKRSFLDPQFTFNFIGFDFLQPLPGNGMIWYYIILGILGILVAIGFKYRFSMFLYAVMWSGVYLMQKTSYNNHYYLLMLLCFIMVLLPAHKFASYDAWKNPKIKKISMPRWVWLLIVVQLLLVYTYGGIAKFYPDWLNGRLPGLLMHARKDYWLVGPILQQPWVPYVVAYFGILFDLLNVPLLLWKKTRWFAFILSVFFHLFNSFIFHIGIFPYLSLAFILFFFPPENINRIFIRQKPFYDKHEIRVPSYKKPLVAFLSVWFLVQVSLPLRHWFFQGNVLWTEEGHRLSWRMMLRARSGNTQFIMVDKATRDTIKVKKDKYLTPKQWRAASSKPDIMWQFAQHLKKEAAKDGKDVSVFVRSRVSINGRPYQDFVDPKVDLAAEEWKPFAHSKWILPASFD